MLDETPAAPPAIAATESTMRIRWAFGGMPSSSFSPASAPIAVMVPMVSKKSASRRVKASRSAASTPTEENAPNRSNCPRVPKSGTSTTPLSSGTLSDQLPGPSSATEPRSRTACSTKASTAVATIEIRIAPRTWRTHRAMMSTTPTAKTSTGHPLSVPPLPSWTGTVVSAASGMRVTKPASTKPMRAMKRPMPTEIAIFSCWGTAWKTALRKPVSTSTRMMMPSRTMRPIASSHVDRVAIAFATNALRPSPVARASGKLATVPIRMVSTPATSAVPAAITGRFDPSPAPPPRKAPVESGTKPRMSGFSTMM